MEVFVSNNLRKNQFYFNIYNIDADKKNFTIVAEDLEKNGIFDDNDSEIIHDTRRKVLTKGEQENIKNKKDKNIKMI